MSQAAVQSRWNRRIDRATELLSSRQCAAEGLRFYIRLAELQRALYTGADELFANAPELSAMPFRERLDSSLLLPQFAAFMSSVESFAPEPLARAAWHMAKRQPDRVQRAIGHFLRDGLNLPPADAAAELPEDQSVCDLHDRFLAWTFLQPFAEYLADRAEPPKLDSTPSKCPVCGSNPIVGVLRPEGNGGKKSLICMLCAYEWDFRRIYCPACGEEREPQMAYYVTPETTHVRVDVCDTCHTYLKTVDLTKTGLAVPVVDELATIPLDLWARDNGYEKLQINLLGS